MTTTNRRAHARTNDPFTSHVAAAVATRSLPTHRALVLAILEDQGGPMTRDQIIREAHRWRMDGRAPGFTEQSLRSRLKELERDELVVELPERHGRSAHGNPAGFVVARTVYERETPRLAMLDLEGVTA